MLEVVSKSINKLVSVFYPLVIFAFILAGTNIYAQDKPAPAENDSVIKAACEIICHLKYCALVTIDSTGAANVRTMNPFPPEADMTVWMATDTRTSKYQDIKRILKLVFTIQTMLEPKVTLQ